MGTAGSMCVSMCAHACEGVRVKSLAANNQLITFNHLQRVKSHLENRCDVAATVAVVGRRPDGDEVL
jgi:hypothetical protein